MNTKLITSLVFILLNVNFTYCQELPKNVRKDFCENAIFNYWYGNDSFKAIMILAARNNGANSIPEIEIQIENLCNNISLQENFFKIIINKGGSSDFVFLEFNGIGMTAKNAKIITDYILEKYKTSVNKIESKTTENISSVQMAYEKNAEFIGGKKELMNYIQNNMNDDLIDKYKKEKSIKKINIIVKFIVDKEGVVTVNNITGLEDSDLKNSIKNIFEQMPKWEPGGVITSSTKTFIPFNCPFTFPITLN